MCADSQHRWYDRDPVLKQALETLRQAEDKYQALVAMNIIMIIVEHQIESKAVNSVDDLVETMESSRVSGDVIPYRRWYDLNETLRSALKLLEDCPEDVQAQIIPSIAAMVETSLTEAL